jgi:group II intron reverse transcriptase/maturase
MLLEFIIIIATIAVISAKNPVHSILFLILVFLNTAILLISLGIDFLGIFIIIVYVGAIAILFLFVVMMLNVRRCADVGRDDKVVHSCFDRMSATGLGKAERALLNLASQMKGSIRPNQDGRVDSPADFSMVRAIMLEGCPQVISHHGSYLACDRVGQALGLLCLRFPSETALGRVSIRFLNAGHNLPKENNHEPTTGTAGSPKGGNPHGDGATIVPAAREQVFPLRHAPLISGDRGRVAGYHSNSWNWAGSGASRGLATSSTNPDKTIQDKLLNLAKWCEANPDKPVDRTLYKLLLDPKLFEIAYNKLKSNPGNLTPGITPTTLDGFSMEWINETILALRDESFQFTPGRRTMIPKADGSQRPLTIAPPRDKIIQEMIRTILDCVFEPTFSPDSHGFRPGRSCHTALKSIHQKFKGVTWIIEGDIRKCFDNIDQRKLMDIVENKILDRKFTNLIWKALDAGYFIFKEYHHSISGTPQGSIISPILANIYLNQMDKFVKELSAEFNQGERCRPNPEYTRLRYLRDRNPDRAKEILKKMHKVNYGDPFDPKFKRLSYARYADDWVIGIRGSLEEAKIILSRVSDFLRTELNLEVNMEKSKITHVGREKALFLGVLIGRSHHRYFRDIRSGSQRMALTLRMEAPLSRVTKKLTEAGFMSNGKPAPRFLWLHNDKDTIITLYNAVLRGYLNYYSFVHNRAPLARRLLFTLKGSCAKLLAAKYSMERQSKVFRKFGKDLKGKDKVGFLNPSYKSNYLRFKVNPSEYIKALYATTISKATMEGLICANCGSEERIEMHRASCATDLNPNLSHIDKLMVARRRKQIPLCRSCHLTKHATAKVQSKTPDGRKGENEA